MDIVIEMPNKTMEFGSSEYEDPQKSQIVFPKWLRQTELPKLCIRISMNIIINRIFVKVNFQ